LDCGRNFVGRQDRIGLRLLQVNKVSGSTLCSKRIDFLPLHACWLLSPVSLVVAHCRWMSPIVSGCRPLSLSVAQLSPSFSRFSEESPKDIAAARPRVMMECMRACQAVGPDAVGVNGRGSLGGRIKQEEHKRPFATSRHAF